MSYLCRLYELFELCQLYEHFDESLKSLENASFCFKYNIVRFQKCYKHFPRIYKDGKSKL